MRFKFITTEFHSGRYAIMFSPFDGDTGSISYAVAGQNYTHREIIDLRDGCEFTFHIPYTSITPYRRLFAPNESFGVVNIYPINPLTAPATVASSCVVLVEVSGAPDVEFAFLRTNGLTLYSPIAPQSAVNFVASENEITSGTIGNSSLVNDNSLNSRHCIGEKVLSLNSILRHNNVILPLIQGITAISATMNPFFIPSAISVTTGTNNNASFYGDHYAMFTSMYASSRGSVRLKVFNNVVSDLNTSEITTATVNYVRTGTNNGITESATPIALTRFALRVIQNSIYRGGIDVQTPPYHHTYARCNIDDYCGDTTIAHDYTSPTSSNLSIDINTALGKGNLYYRQVADDFQLGTFISTPCCINPS